MIGVNHQPTTTMKLICNLPAKQIKAIYAKYDRPEDRFDALVEAERDEMEWGSYPSKEEEAPSGYASNRDAGYDDAYFDQLLKDEEADTFFWPNGIHMYCENAVAYFNRPDIYNPQRDDTY